MAPEPAASPQMVFDTDQDRTSEPGPKFVVTWRIEDAEGKNGRTVEREFRCLAPGQVPWSTTNDMIRTRTDGIIGEWGMGRFLRGCLIVEDEEVWDELTSEKGRIPGATISRIFQYLLHEAYAKRPTAPPSGSPAGRDQTADGSTENSPSQATPAEPEPVSASAST